MSDVPPGPGWWIASDGRWYPPEAHPTAAAPSPWVPQGAPGYPAPQWGTAPPGWSSPPQWGAPGAPGWSPYAPYGPPPVAYPMGSPLFIDPILGLPLAPWWKRACALLIDSVIVFVVLLVVIVILTLALGTAVRPAVVGTGPRPFSGFGLLVIYLVAFGGELLYYGLCNGSARGQTVGKVALRIAVRDARTGGPIGVWRGVGRAAILIVFDIPLGIPLLIDYLAPLWDGRRQAWHDKVAHSVVVELPG